MQGNKELLITVMCRHTLKQTSFAVTLLEIRVLFIVVILFKCNLFWYFHIKLFKTVTDFFFLLCLFLRT